MTRHGKKKKQTSIDDVSKNPCTSSQLRNTTSLKERNKEKQWLEKEDSQQDPFLI